MAPHLDNLGDLELAVLQYVWREGPSEVKTVHAALGPEREISHNTVQSALKRLYEKELLTRHKDGHAYVYSPRLDREEVTERRVAEVVEQLADGELDVALTAFVNFAERAGDETLERLEALVARRKCDDGEE
ncbi:MAG: BlaI/MecI/CopY family transcriptional regulator [Bradymonadaceae bacterium]